MSDVRNLSLRQWQPEQPRPRASRAYQECKPGPDDEGEIGEDHGTAPTADQDRKFQDAMLKAIARKLEHIPREDRLPVHDSVPMRRHMPGQVFTASNLEN